MVLEQLLGGGCGGGGGSLPVCPKGDKEELACYFMIIVRLLAKPVRVSLDSLRGGALRTGRFIGNRPFDGILRWLRETAQHEDHSESTGFKGKLCRHHSG